MYDNFIQRVEEVGEKYENSGIKVSFDDGIIIAIYGDFEKFFVTHYHYRDGSGSMILSSNDMDSEIYLYSSSFRQKGTFFQLPVRVVVGSWTVKNRDLRKSRRSKGIEADLQRSLSGEEFPFDKYPQEADDIRYLLWGKEKVGKFLDYVGRIAPEAIGLTRELEKLPVMSQREALEIIDKPLTREEMEKRQTEAIELENFEEAGYWKDKLSELSGAPKAK